MRAIGAAIFAYVLDVGVAHDVRNSCCYKKKMQSRLCREFPDSSLFCVCVIMHALVRACSDSAQSVLYFVKRLIGVML